MRVTSKNRKPVNVLMVTRKGVKRLTVNDNTQIKFAA